MRRRGQVEALTQSLREAEASVAGKEREVQEVMQAFEELESESHSQVAPTLSPRPTTP